MQEIIERMRKLDDDTAQTIDQQLKGEKAKLNAKE